MTLGMNGPLVPAREHAATQLARPWQLLLMMWNDNARYCCWRSSLRRLHYDILCRNLDRLLLQLQLQALLIVLRRRIRLLLLLDHIVQSFAQRCNVCRRHVLEFIHMNNKLVPPCERLVAHLKDERNELRLVSGCQDSEGRKIQGLLILHKYRASPRCECACESWVYPCGPVPCHRLCTRMPCWWLKRFNSYYYYYFFYLI